MPPPKNTHSLHACNTYFDASDAHESELGKGVTDEKPPDRGEARETAHGDRPERLLVIVAHPDDADFGAAATVAKWVREGTVARLVCCTSGDAGADDARTDPLELARRREDEQRAASRVVGYEGVDFLHRPDGALENDLALREQLVRIIRQFKPDTIMISLTMQGQDGPHNFAPGFGPMLQGLAVGLLTTLLFTLPAATAMPSRVAPPRATRARIPARASRSAPACRGESRGTTGRSRRRAPPHRRDR